MEKILRLALECANKNWTYDRSETIKGIPIVYKTETQTDILYFWNSANNNGTILNVPRALSYISEALVNGELNGQFTIDTDCEVMYEVKEK